MQVSAKSTNSDLKTDKLLPSKSNSKSTVSSGVKVVEIKFISSK